MSDTVTSGPTTNFREMFRLRTWNFEVGIWNFNVRSSHSGQFFPFAPSHKHGLCPPFIFNRPFMWSIAEGLLKIKKREFWCSGFRVEGSGFGVWGLGVWVFRVQVFRCSGVQDKTRHDTPDTTMHTHHTTLHAHTTTTLHHNTHIAHIAHTRTLGHVHGRQPTVILHSIKIWFICHFRIFSSCSKVRATVRSVGVARFLMRPLRVHDARWRPNGSQGAWQPSHKDSVICNGN